MPLVSFLAGWAIPVLVDISLVFVSVAFLLLVWAGYILFATPFRLLASAVPFIGSQLSDAIGSISNGIKSWAESWATGNIAGLLRLIVLTPQVIIALVGTIVGAFEWLIGQVVNLGSWVTNTGAWLVVQIGAVGVQILTHSGLIALLQTAVSNAANSATWIINTFVPAQIRDAIGAVERDITSAVGAAVAGIQTDIKAVQDGVATDISDAVQGVETDIQAVRDGVATDIAAVKAGLETDFADAVAGVQTDIAVNIGAIEDAIETALGVKGIFDVIALTTLIFQHPEEAAKEVAAASEQFYHLADPLIDVLTGRQTAVGIGSIAWPELHQTQQPAPPPHGQ